jgi:hypothetical protein
MSGVVHVVARAVVDDPHTLAVLALAEAMAPKRRARVAAADGQRAVKGVGPLDARTIAGDATIVYHARGAAPALVRRLTERAGRVAVVHADPIPDPLAWRDLRALASSGAIGLATSDAAAERLSDAGVACVERVPPVVARARLAAVPVFEPTAHHLAVAVHGPLVLAVDDMVTATSAARVVQAYHVLRTYLVRSSRLTLAIVDGCATSEIAVQRVSREVWGLRLADAWVQRLANPGERAAFTRRASVFVTADPVVGDVRHALAAMAEGVPVVAPAIAGVADALGDGALLLPPDAGAALVAEAVAELLTDEARRGRFAAGAARAVARFEPAVVAPAWLSALAS